MQIAAEGRKYGLYLLASTQRPGKVHENVVSQCDNLVLMRMNSTADLADLGRLFSFVAPGLLAGAPVLRHGPGPGQRPALPAGRAPTSRWAPGCPRRAGPTSRSRGPGPGLSERVTPLPSPAACRARPSSRPHPGA